MSNIINRGTWDIRRHNYLVRHYVEQVAELLMSDSPITFRMPQTCEFCQRISAGLPSFSVSASSPDPSASRNPSARPALRTHTARDSPPASSRQSCRVAAVSLSSTPE